MVLTPPEAADWLAVTDASLPVSEALAFAGDPGCGGIVCFCGTVRDHAEGRPGVETLTYEAYVAGAERALIELAEMARARWPVLGRLVMLHRTGTLAVGDAAVVVVASAPHRDEAFEAARYLIDELKRSVPIWKHERWAGGSGWSPCAEPLGAQPAIERG